MKHLYRLIIRCTVVILAIAIFLFALSCTNYNSHKIESASKPKHTSSITVQEDTYYILNKDSKKVHKSTCGTAALIIPENREDYFGSLYTILAQGYTKCGNCFR